MLNHEVVLINDSYIVIVSNVHPYKIEYILIAIDLLV